jgi:hypothetical protein
MKGLITNDRDRANLEFLMACDNETLEDWFRHTGTDDLDYAWELLAAYSRELDLAAEELRVEAELEQLDSYPTAEQIIRNIAQ